MRCWFFTLVFVLLSQLMIGQTPDDEWVFGYNSRLSFAGGSPVDLGWSPVYTEEGSSSISNKNGDLLFSVQGSNVFDRNGNSMQGGSLLNGNTSSTQNSIIVPSPGDAGERFYHVFTVSAQNDYWKTIKHTGLEHTIVDMQANGGLGAVVFAPNEIVPLVAEKLHATRHANGRDVWVVTHLMNSNAYFAVPITCEGLGEPVISYGNIYHSTTVESFSAQGALKISHDGAFIACTHSPLELIGAGDAIRDKSYLEVGSFNNSTGEVVIMEDIVQSYPISVLSMGYGIEFSPDNTKLYWSIEKNQSELYQFDMTSSPIEISKTLISTDSPSIAALQLGPDGKIYVSRTGGSSRLYVIENPNDSVNALVYNKTTGPEISGYLTHGLPNNWMYPYSEPEPKILFKREELCLGNIVELDPRDSLGSKLIWNNGSIGDTLLVNEPGNYWVTQYPCSFDTVFYEVEPKEFCLCELFVPNTFTPDGDKQNDFFGGVSECDLINYQFQVFDRWGGLVFETNDQYSFWDGRMSNSKLLKQGMYSWKASWDIISRGTYLPKSKKGHVTLLK